MHDQCNKRISLDPFLAELSRKNLKYNYQLFLIRSESYLTASHLIGVVFNMLMIFF